MKEWMKVTTRPSFYHPVSQSISQSVIQSPNQFRIPASPSHLNNPERARIKVLCNRGAAESFVRPKTQNIFNPTPSWAAASCLDVFLCCCCCAAR